MPRGESYKGQDRLRSTLAKGEKILSRYRKERIPRDAAEKHEREQTAYEYGKSKARKAVDAAKERRKKRPAKASGNWMQATVNRRKPKTARRYESTPKPAPSADNRLSRKLRKS